MPSISFKKAYFGTENLVYPVLTFCVNLMRLTYTFMAQERKVNFSFCIRKKGSNSFLRMRMEVHCNIQGIMGADMDADVGTDEIKDRRILQVRAGVYCKNTPVNHYVLSPVSHEIDLDCFYCSASEVRHPSEVVTNFTGVTKFTGRPVSYNGGGPIHARVPIHAHP